MATLVEPPLAIRKKGKHCYSMWQTLFEIDDKYIPIKPIGKGSYGVVCSSVNRETNEKVAIKKIADVFDSSIDGLRALREVTLLRQLRHVNVITLKDVMVPTHKTRFKDLYLVYELMDTDLHEIISSKQPLCEDQVKYFIFQLLCGLKYLHSANVLHRDLKPTNLFLNANCDLKIGDFGLARTTAISNDEYMTEYVVSRWYRAPELLVGSGTYTTSIDVWSAGCIFAEILGRTPIFPGKDYLHQLRLIIDKVGTHKAAEIGFIESPNAKRFIESVPFSPGTSFSDLYPSADPLAVDLLEKMLVFDPSKRITAVEALEHPYVGNLYDPRTDRGALFPIHLDFDDFMGEGELRKQMLEEMIYFHPELAFIGRRR